MTKYFQHFGLERDPFLDTADPFFYCEIGAIKAAKARLISSVKESRGLGVTVGEPGTGKTSLCSSFEQAVLSDDQVLLGKILDPTFGSDIEFLIAVGRAFGLGLPPRSAAALKNAIKNALFDNAVLENRIPVLIIDEAQALSDENLETLRVILNFHVPQKKLLNVLLFGQPELERRIHARSNLTDRVDTWVHLDRLPPETAGAVLDFRLTQAGLPAGRRIFSTSANALLLATGDGLPRRMLMLAHSAMQEACDRGAAVVDEVHVRSVIAARGLANGPAAPAPPAHHPSVPMPASIYAMAGAAKNGTSVPTVKSDELAAPNGRGGAAPAAGGGFLARFFAKFGG